MDSKQMDSVARLDGFPSNWATFDYVRQKKKGENMKFGALLTTFCVFSSQNSTQASQF